MDADGGHKSGNQSLLSTFLISRNAGFERSTVGNGGTPGLETAQRLLAEDLGADHLNKPKPTISVGVSSVIDAKSWQAFIQKSQTRGADELSLHCSRWRKLHGSLQIPLAIGSPTMPNLQMANRLYYRYRFCYLLTCFAGRWSVGS